MLSDEWLPRYRLLENFTAKWNGNGNGNAYDRGDYNSSFALHAVELKTIVSDKNLIECFFNCKMMTGHEIIDLKKRTYSISARTYKTWFSYCCDSQVK